jgi:hemolysin-activating ACP:hemolysin acyltransferase
MINIHAIVNLYKQLPEYKENTPLEIYQHILPSIKLGQYKLHIKNNKIIGFSNWAYLNELEEEYFIKTNQIRNTAWNSGNIIWKVDVVAISNAHEIVNWSKNYFSRLLGVGRKVKWQRLKNNEVIIKEITTKEHYINGK